jgi:hypothetical protein
MNIYDWNKRVISGPAHCDDGYMYAANGDMIAQEGPDACSGEEIAYLAHCRNYFMEALEALKECTRDRGHAGYCCVNHNHADEKFCDCGLKEYEKLITKLEEVK